MRWKTTVTLRQRRIESNGDVFGWNDWYNPATKQWELLTLTNGATRYPLTDFSDLFN